MEVDRDALLCALVLAPVTFARNRFFTLYTLPWARRTRSRATQLRTMVRHLSAQERWRAEVRDMRPSADGGVVLRYGVPGLSLERTALLDPLEIAVIRFALSRRTRPCAEEAAMTLTEDDRRRVETALAKLTPFDRSPAEFGESAPSDEPEADSVPTPPTEGDNVMCLFCKMVTREIPAKILFEDDDLLAFWDIRPAAPTHVLVIPKKHIDSLNEASPEDALLLGKLLLAAQRVAREAGLSDGWRVVVNTGQNAGQSVFHVHLHVLGGCAMGWPPI